MRQSVLSISLLVSICLISFNFPGLALAQEETDDTAMTKEPVVVIVSEENAGTIQAQEEQTISKEAKDESGKSSGDLVTLSEKGGEGIPTMTLDDESKIASIKLENATFTGSANLSFPLNIPTGRGGLTPDLKLVYNSYLKNGPLGVGWSLSMLSIQRCTQFGLDYSRNNFVYSEYGMTQELVERSEWGSDHYGAKIDGDFKKYYFNNTTGGWEVSTREGWIYYFGSTAASRKNTTGADFAWYLDSIIGPNGNYIEYYYIKDQNELYLQQIRYTGGNSVSPSHSITFYYESRSDIEKSYRTNDEVVIEKRIHTIEIKTGPNFVRAYAFQYTISSNTNRSLLETVTEYGNDTEVDANGDILSGSVLPSTAISYTAPANSLEGGAYGSYQIWSSASWSPPTSATADVNGDGIKDFVSFETGGLYVALSDGTGIPNGKEQWSSANWNYYTVPHGLADVNGDGKTDFITFETGGLYVALSDGTGIPNGKEQWSSTNWNPTTAPHGLADVNGDGKTDFITFETGGLYVALSDGTGIPNGKEKWSSANWYPTTRPHGLADVNGDGKTDFISFQTNGLYIWVSNGTGIVGTNPDKSGGYQKWSKYNWHPNARDSKLGDVNGDGKTDFISFQYNGLYIWISEGTGIAGTNADLSGGYQMWSNSDWRFENAWPEIADVNGDGKIDFVTFQEQSLYAWISDGTGIIGTNPDKSGGSILWNGIYRWKPDPSERVHHLADVNGDNKADVVTFEESWEGAGLKVLPVEFGEADLIDEISDPLGSISTVQYTPSSNYNNTRLPNVVNLISSITTNDGLGSLSTATYNYEGGLYDCLSREFRGFETVTRTNPDGTIVETKYHQDEFRKGRVAQEGLWAAGADPAVDTPLALTTNTWDTEYLDYPDNTTAFVKLSQTRTDYNDAVTVFTQQNFTYDSTNGNPLTVTASGTGAENVTTTLTWQNFGTWLWRKTGETLTGATSGQVRQTTYEYESYTGNLTAEEKWLATGTNPRVTYQYDAYGNVTHQTDARNTTTVIDYDTATATFPVKITYPSTGGVSHIVEMEWDARFGKKTWDKDENGNVTTYAYDPFGRMAQTDLPDGGQITKSYFDDVVPRYILAQVKEDAAGSTIDSYRYLDGLNREVQTVAFGEGGQTIITQAFYDEMGRLSLKKGPFYGTGSGYPQTPPAEYPWQQIYYDNRSRPIAVESPHIQYGTIETSMAYSGFDTTVTDPDGAEKTESKDYLGRIVQVTEYNGVEQYHTDYAYNAAGDLTSVTDHLNNVTTVSWDTLGRKTAMDDPDMGAWSYTYDANGNLLTQTDAKNQVITFTYDELNRMTYKSYSTSDPAVAYLYDNTTAGKNGIGRLKSVESSQAVISYKAYDAMGRVLEESKQIVGNATVYTTSYAYDLSGKKVQTVHPDSTIVSNSFYPGTNLLNTITGAGATTYATISQYQPNGKIGQIDHGNAAVTTYSYDAWSEKLTGIVTRDYLDAEIQNRSYLYSPAGDIEEIADTVNNIEYSYTYDDLHRLTGETNTGPEDSLFYTYNAIGNMTSRGAGLVSVDYSYNPAHPHAVSSLDLFGTPFNYAYDANGNMTSGYDFTNPSSPALRTLAWNADNMPVSVTRSGVTTTFKYDGMGQRAKKQVGSAAPTYYIGTEYEVIAGVGTKYIFAGNLRIAKVASTGVYYFHKDHLGSSTVMTGDTGAAVEASEYRPYGSFRSQSGTEVSDYKFTDQEWDAESGLYNYDARLYDPVIGRFISGDSTVQYPFDPQSLNRYSYCRNNPLIYVDPSGYSWAGDVADAIGDALGEIGDAIGDAVGAVGDAIGAVGGAIGGALGAVGDDLGQAFDAFGGWSGLANLGSMGYGIITGNPVAFAAGAYGLISRAATGNYTGAPVDVSSVFGGPSGGGGEHLSHGQNLTVGLLTTITTWGTSLVIASFAGAAISPVALAGVGFVAGYVYTKALFGGSDDDAFNNAGWGTVGALLGWSAGLRVVGQAGYAKALAVSCAVFTDVSVDVIAAQDNEFSLSSILERNK